MMDAGKRIRAMEASAGIPLPLGAHERGGGVNFAVFSRHAARVSLLLFDKTTAMAPYRTMELDPERHRGIFLFVRGMIELRRRHKILREEQFYTDRDILWFDERGAEPRWDGPGRTLGCRIRPPGEGEAALCLLFNAGGSDEEFLLPSAAGGRGWQVVVDTAQAAPFGEGTAGGAAKPPLRDRYRLQNRSMAILTGG